MSIASDSVEKILDHTYSTSWDVRYSSRLELRMHASNPSKSALE